MEILTLLTTYRVKYLSAIRISYELKPYMPLRLLSVVFLFLLLLLHGVLS